MRSADEVRLIKEMCSQEVESFLVANSVDMGAANQLRREPVHVALAVIERGPLRACRDPSGVIVARMRDARNGTLLPDPSANRGQAGTVVPMDSSTTDVDRFITANGIDASAAIALRSELPDVQRAVMAKGPLSQAANPSASLLARIRMVKEPGAMLAPVPMPPPAIPPSAPAGPLDLNDEVLKAVQKLQNKEAKPPPPPPPSPAAFMQQRPPGMQMQPAPRPVMQQPQPMQALPDMGGYSDPNVGKNDIADTADRQLQDEALRIIQSLSYQEG